MPYLSAPIQAACRRVLPLLLLTLIPAGCQTTQAPPPPSEPDPTILRVGPEGSKPIAFHKIIINIPQGQAIGSLRRGNTVVMPLEAPSLNEGGPSFGQITREELSKAGYTVRGAQNVVFGDDEAAKTRLQLGAEITKLRWDINVTPWTGETSGSGTMTTRFQVYDTYIRRVVFEEEETVNYYSENENDNDLLSMYRKTVQKLLSEEGFHGFLTSDAQTAQDSVKKYDDELEVILGDKPINAKLPGGFQDLLRAVVVIEQGFAGGTGLLISPEGYVLTAAHVVSDLEQVRVKFNSGVEFLADVVRVNNGQDVALLKLQGRGHGWLPIQFEEAEKLTGSDIFVVGHPLGEMLGFSVSKGIISGFREIDDQKFLQLDASVNEGNSGGPVLTTDGKVVGLVSWKVAGEGIEGLSFAIPMARVLEALNIKLVEPE